MGRYVFNPPICPRFLFYEYGRRTDETPRFVLSNEVEKGVVKRLVVFYRHFQDAAVLSAFFKEESEVLTHIFTTPYN